MRNYNVENITGLPSVLARRSLAVTAMVVAAILLIVGSGCSKQEALETTILTNENNHAVSGYDVVSYFADAEPSKGSAKFSTDWQGAVWLFASSKNRALFIANPNRYAPQYGGWCAFGMAEGYAAETDPLNAWSIVDDKLYLNWDKEVAEEWSANTSEFIIQAEQNWPEVEGGLKVGDATIYRHDD